MKMTLSFFSLVILIISIVSLLIGIFVLVKNFKNPVNQSFFIMVAGIFIWGFGFSFLMITREFGIFEKVTLYGGLVLSVGFYIFSKVFLTDHNVFKKLWLHILPSILPAVILPLNLVMTNVIFHADGHVQPENGRLFFLYALVTGTYLLLSFFNLIKKYLITKGEERNRISYVVLGISFFLITAIIFDLLLPFLGISHLNFIGFIAPIVMVSCIAYAIVKHQVFDIRVILQKSFLYFILLIFISSIYLGLLWFIEYVIHLTFQAAPLVSGFGTLMVGLATLPRIEKFLRMKTNSWFFQDNYNYKEAVNFITHIIYTYNSLDQIKSLLSDYFKQIFHTNSASIEIYDKPRPYAGYHLYESLGLEMDIPILLDQSIHGMIHLGVRKSQDRYVEKDRNLLINFSYQIALVMEKIRLYKKVEYYSHSLENIIEERTRKINELHERQEKILVDIAHNIQTPLTVVKGELELIRPLLKSNQKLSGLEKGIDRVSNFMYQLLRLATFGEGSQKMVLQPFSVSKLLSENIDYFKTVGSSYEAQVTSEIEENLYIHGDVSKIQECVNNIVSNAFKYSRPQQKNLVNIKLYSREKYIVIEISDTGRGVPENDKEKIFERLFRSRDMNQASVEGSGLGLAMCKKIIEAHHGDIHVQSDLGLGSKFIIKLPLFH